MRHTLLAFSAFCLLFAYCRSQNSVSDINKVDITRKYTEMEVKLSDFAEDIQIVRLETHEDALVRQYWGYVGERYIIAVDLSRVLLFASDGKYICEIARRGNGPGEYSQVDAWTVDEREQYFLYHEKGKGYLNRYNLGKRLQDGTIPLPGKGGLGNLISLNDNLLAVLPGMFSDYGYRWFLQDTAGQIISGIKKEPVPHPGAWAGLSPIFLKGAGNSVIFQPSESDTVFRIAGREMKPEMVFIPEKPSVSGDIVTGSDAIYMFQNKKYLFIRNVGYEKTVTGSSASISPTTIENLLVEKRTGDLKKVSRFVYEFGGIELTVPYVAFQGNGRFFTTFQAFEFRQQIKEALSSTADNRGKGNEVRGAGVSMEPRQALEKLLSEISENDNPVLITGRIK